MSGGHFDYKCFIISQFAEELQHAIEINSDDSLGEYGTPIGACFSDGTLFRLKRAQQIIDTAGNLAKEIEWLYSGDHGDDSFNKLFDKIIADSQNHS